MNIFSKILTLFALVVFTACSSSQKQNIVCQDDCEKWCSLGCYATQGPTKCIFLEDGSMPCCEALAKGISLKEFKTLAKKNNYRVCKSEQKN